MSDWKNRAQPINQGSWRDRATQINEAENQYQPDSMGYRFITGITDPVYGIGQMVPRGLEAVTSLGGLAPNPVSRLYGKSARRIDEAAKAREAQYNAPEGFDWARTFGNVASPVNWVFIGGGGGGGGLLRTAGIGAASAATQPIQDTENFTSNKAMQAGTGALTGGVLYGGGKALGKILNPAVDTAKQALERSGVNLTLGQKMGGLASDIEQKIQSYPVVGSMIAKRRSEALEQWNKSVVDDIVKPLGGKITQSGHEGIKQAQNILDDAYTSAKSAMKPFQIDNQAAQEINAIKQIVSTLPKTEQDYFNNILNRVQTGVKGNTIDPDSYKKITSELGKKAISFKSAQSPYQKDLGDAFFELEKAVTGAAKRQNPQQAYLMDIADEAYAKLVRIEGAAKSAASNRVNTGVFTPNQLMSAVRTADQSVRDRSTAGGGALMQDVAQTGMRIIGDTVPDSGTAGRMAALLMGGGAYSAGEYTDNPYLKAAGMAALGGTALYTPQGQKLAKTILTERPELSRTLGKVLSNYTPYLTTPSAMALAKE